MNLVRLFLQRFERGADLLVPVATRVLDLLSEMVVSHVHIRVIAGPLDVRHVQSNLSFYVLHRLLDARRELLRAGHAYTSRKMNIGLLSGAPRRRSSVVCNIPFTRYSRLSNRFYNRFDNRLYRVNKHATGC